MEGPGKHTGEAIKDLLLSNLEEVDFSSKPYPGFSLLLHIDDLGDPVPP